MPRNRFLVRARRLSRGRRASTRLEESARLDPLLHRLTLFGQEPLAGRRESYAVTSAKAHGLRETQAACRGTDQRGASLRARVLLSPLTPDGIHRRRIRRSPPIAPAGTAHRRSTSRTESPADNAALRARQASEQGKPALSFERSR